MTRPTIRNRFYILCRDVALLGTREAFRYYAGRLRRRMHKPDIPSTDHEVEPRFGVDTIQSMPDDLRIRSTNKKWGVHYWPTPEHLFRNMLHFVQADLEDYVFVDMGAGEGLALLMASEYPFKRVIGVEYSEALAAIAQKNIAGYSSQTQRCRDLTCLCADASDFSFPPEPTVLYFYNPFQGKVMDRVIKNIELSLQRQPRNLWIVYYIPWEHRKFRRSRDLRIAESNWKFCVYRCVQCTTRAASSGRKVNDSALQLM
jgi:hypothetical protein